MGMIFGMFFALPSIEIQALFGVIAFCISENAAVILLFFWWMRDTCNIFQHCFSHLVDDLKPKRMAHLQDDGRYRRTHPPWPDAAPYLPFGGCYGYAMSQYQFKKKSGHASSKHGGECEPITSCTITHWLAFTPFWIALLYAIIFLMTSLFPSRNADCVNADVSLPIDTAAGHTFTSWGWASDTRKLLQLQVQSRLSGTLPILHAVHELLYDSLSRISWFLGKTNCLRKVLRYAGRRASMGTDSMGTALPGVEQQNRPFMCTSRAQKHRRRNSTINRFFFPGSDTPQCHPKPPTRFVPRINTIITQTSAPLHRNCEGAHA